jgi:hypothetical protein
MVVVEAYEHHIDQVYRYMSGKGMDSPRTLHIFSPGGFLFMCEKLETEMAHVWKAVAEVVQG